MTSLKKHWLPFAYLCVVLLLVMSFTGCSPSATSFDDNSAAVAQVNVAGQAGNEAINVNAILAAHNQYRAEVGVAPLTWSATLAAGAQDWSEVIAAENRLRHDNGDNLGENLAAGTIGAFSPVSFVNLWGSEKENFTPGGVFPRVSTTGNWADVGHYTQIIWSNTTEVGCGIADGDTMHFFACRYSPPGNRFGETPY